MFSFSVRGRTDAFKKYVLDEGGYFGSKDGFVDEDSELKIKSRVIARDINVTMRSGKTAPKTVCEKQVVFRAQKYADKARAERGELVNKAMALVAGPRKYSKATSYGATKYVKNLEFGKQTGELIEGKKQPSFDSDRLAEDKKQDGYYAIVTSKLEVIIRLMQKTTNRRSSAEKIISCLNSITCSNEQDNLHLFNYRSEISDMIGEKSV